jgi:hypothetical protein
MKAGRELNELVAEKVMGWRYVTFPDGAMPHVKHWHGPNDECLLPDFSGSINAAWQLVEKLIEAGWNVGVDKYARTSPCVEVNIWNAGNDEVIQLADTAPLAICLAALKTVRVIS